MIKNIVLIFVMCTGVNASLFCSSTGGPSLIDRVRLACPKFQYSDIKSLVESDKISVTMGIQLFNEAVSRGSKLEEAADFLKVAFKKLLDALSCDACDDKYPLCDVCSTVRLIPMLVEKGEITKEEALNVCKKLVDENKEIETVLKNLKENEDKENEDKENEDGIVLRFAYSRDSEILKEMKKMLSKHIDLLRQELSNMGVEWADDIPTEESTERK